MRMKCKHCGDRTNVFIWLMFLGKCLPCDIAKTIVEQGEYIQEYDKEIDAKKKYFRNLNITKKEDE